MPLIFLFSQKVPRLPSHSFSVLEKERIKKIGTLGIDNSWFYWSTCLEVLLVVGSTSFNIACYAHVKYEIIIVNDYFIFILMLQLVGHTFGYCDISVLKGHWVSTGS